MIVQPGSSRHRASGRADHRRRRCHPVSGDVLDLSANVPVDTWMANPDTDLLRAHRRKSLRNVVIALVVIALLVGGILFVLHAMNDGDDEPPDRGPAHARRDGREGVRSTRPTIDAGMSKDDIVAISKFGFFSINANAKTTIYVDNRTLGETPMTRLPLPPGPHKVKAVGPRGKKPKSSSSRSSAVATPSEHDQLVNVLVAAALGIALGVVTGMPLGVVNVAIVDAATAGRTRFAIGVGLGGALADTVHAALAFVGVGRARHVASRARARARDRRGDRDRRLRGARVAAPRDHAASPADDSSMLHGAIDRARAHAAESRRARRVGRRRGRDAGPTRRSRRRCALAVGVGVGSAIVVRVARALGQPRASRSHGARVIPRVALVALVGDRGRRRRPRDADVTTRAARGGCSRSAGSTRGSSRSARDRRRGTAARARPDPESGGRRG